jgi:hypothetical protein
MFYWPPIFVCYFFSVVVADLPAVDAYRGVMQFSFLGSSGQSIHIKTYAINLYVDETEYDFNKRPIASVVSVRDSSGMPVPFSKVGYVSLPQFGAHFAANLRPFRWICDDVNVSECFDIPKGEAITISVASTFCFPALKTEAELRTEVGGKRLDAAKKR